MLSLPSLLGPGVSTELKQGVKIGIFLITNTFWRIFHENPLWDTEWHMEAIFNLWTTLKSELVSLAVTSEFLIITLRNILALQINRI